MREGLVAKIAGEIAGHFDRVVVDLLDNGTFFEVFKAGESFDFAIEYCPGEELAEQLPFPRGSAAM